MENLLNGIIFISKAELSKKLNISSRRLNKLLNKDLYSELEKTGYRPSRKTLELAQIKIVKTYLVGIK